jgi:predicted lipid-binding transport protein (Tim44 family)
MLKKRGAFAAIVFTLVLLFGLSLALESAAWARAGGGSSSGSRGSRSFSAPSAPSRPSPSPAPGTPSPGYQAPGAGAPPSSGWFGGSPFMQGLAGGIAGGFLGSMLFGRPSYGAVGGGLGGSGIGLFELILIGAIVYFGIKYLRRRREGAASDAYYSGASDREPGSYSQTTYQAFAGPSSSQSGAWQQPQLPIGEVERGFEEIRRLDPGFSEETFKETAEDLFFRIQAAWINRSLEGVERLLTPEMSQYFQQEFTRMKREGRINRLENIAVRKVEPSEVWQEEGLDYITVLFTANLLDYVTDDKTGAVIEGDKLNPVKFQEFWTFSRRSGSAQWQLTGINQIGEPSPQTH